MTDGDSLESIQSMLSLDQKNEDNFSEEEMILQIEHRVAELMQEDFGLLMSYLYRLDVPEHQIEACLKSLTSIHPHTCLANLIWNRQKQRMATKEKYKQKTNIEKDWEW